MEKKLRKDKIWLFPNYFKRIGLVVIIFPIIAIIIIKVFGIEFTQTQREILKIFSMNFLDLGLLFVAFSKDKIEDELIIQIRFKAMAISFIFAAAYSIMNPLTYLIFNDPIKELSSQQLVGSMLLFYLIWFYLLKRNR
jgi:hypothetical protein